MHLYPPCSWQLHKLVTPHHLRTMLEATLFSMSVGGVLGGSLRISLTGCVQCLMVCIPAQYEVFESHVCSAVWLVTLNRKASKD